jgi:CelD/BcsL family acetyltransferase involved in cellulose biosynthesis
MSLRIERLASPKALEALVPEWELLDASLSPRTPFTSPLWNILWWKHFGEKRPMLHDVFFAHVVRDASGNLVSVAPMVVTHRPAVSPALVRVLQFFGADSNITEIRGLACRAEHQDEVTQALKAHFLTFRNEWDWLHWSGLRHSEPECLPQVQREKLIPGLDVLDYYLDLPRSWEELRSRLPRNIKESLRKCSNSLKRDGHSFVFRAVDQPSAAQEALERFFALHKARADVRGTIPHRNKFRTARNRAFLIEYAHRIAERDGLRVFQLEISGVVLATRLGFVLGNEVYLFCSGYDPRWGKYGVMTTLLAESIKWAIERGFTRVNLSTGNDVSKTRWRPTEIIFHDAMQICPTLRGRIAFKLYDFLRRSSSIIH